MKRNKEKKISEDALIFDFNNFINKSSQQRYYELKNEVKNKLDKISDDVNIAGSNEKEKKYNLLMYYKDLLDDFDFVKERKENDFQLTSTYVMIVAMTFVALCPVIFSYLEKRADNYFTCLLYSSIVAAGIMATFLLITNIVYSELVEIKEGEKMLYSYCKFYYNELKKYIKEDD